MANSGATTAYGIILKKGNGGSPESFSDYGWEIPSGPDGWGVTREAISAFHHQSPDGYDEFIFGKKSVKPFSVEIHFIPSQASATQTLLEGAQNNWRIQFPDNTSVTFRAGISSFSLGTMTPDGKMTATVEFTVSGRAVWA